MPAPPGPCSTSAACRPRAATSPSPPYVSARTGRWGAKALGIGLLIVPALHGADRPTDAAGWRAVGAELGRMARRLQGDGLRFAFHNHAWEVHKLPDGSLPLDLLLDAGAEDGLGWQADLAWLVRGGDDPARPPAPHRGRAPRGPR